MRRQTIENSAIEVANQVRAVEDSIEAALMEVAELQMRMIRARAAAGVGIVTGHAALEKVASALNGLVTARGGMADCHQELLAAKQQVPGLRTVSFGDGECPKVEFAHLRAVG
jgi:hypothetical protein